MKYILGLSFVLAMIATARTAEPQMPRETFRDSHGHIVGTSSTASTGVTTFRDSSGHFTGTTETSRFGTTTFRDSKGHITGTATRR